MVLHSFVLINRVLPVWQGQGAPTHSGGSGLSLGEITDSKFLTFTAGTRALPCWWVNCVSHTGGMAFLELLLGEMRVSQGLE